jgi:hypothetical protein
MLFPYLFFCKSNIEWIKLKIKIQLIDDMHNYVINLTSWFAFDFFK